jgi:hypothetical protein
VKIYVTDSEIEESIRENLDELTVSLGLDKQEVVKEALDFLNKNKESKNLNLRTLIMVCKMRQSYPDTWEGLASYMLYS